MTALYVFYKISCKDETIKDCYIGSTTNIVSRMLNHKRRCINEDNSKHHYKVYETIRANKGWDNWEIIILEKTNITDKTQSRMKEQEFIDLYSPTLNQIDAYVSPEDRKEKMRILTEKNRRLAKQNNLEAFKEKKKIEDKKHYEKHKEKILGQCKEYNLKNRTERLIKQKAYCDANRERINEERREKIMCECGKIYTHSNKNRHYKTAFHIHNALINNSNSTTC